MVAKPILDIQVNDGAFKAFQDALVKYQETLKELPGQWSRVGEAAEDALSKAIPSAPSAPSGGGRGPGAAPTAVEQQAINQATRARPNVPGSPAPAATSYTPTWSWAPGGFTPGVSPGGGGGLPPISIPATPGGGGGGPTGAAAWTHHTINNVVNIRQAAQAQQAQVSWQKRARDEAVSSFKGMAATTKNVAENIAGATKNLLKWTGIATIFSGLLGAGSLFGLDRLANSVAGGYRASTGLGTVSGNQEAFRLNYSRYLDTDSILSNVADAQQDSTKRWAFGAIGLTPQQASGDTADVAVRVTDAAKKLIDRLGPNLTQQSLDASGLSVLGITLDQARRLAKASVRDLNTQQGQYNTDKQALALDPNTQKAWTNFQTQLGRAGDVLENDFVRLLTSLTGPLGDLSKSISDTFTAITNNKDIGGWIKDLSGYIEDLAKWIGSPSFQTDVQAFITDVSKLGHAIGNAFTWLMAHLPASITGGNSVDANASGFAVPAGGFTKENDPTGVKSYLQNLAADGKTGDGSDLVRVGVAHLGEGPGTIGSFLKANGDQLDAAKNAWCAAFVNSALHSIGLKGTGSDVATSFAGWGGAGDATHPLAGDVAVIMRGHKQGETGGHVGILTGRQQTLRNGRTQDEMISGNEGGKVSTTWEDVGSFVDRRMATNANNPQGPGRNNPGNIRGPGGVGFANYSSADAGVFKMYGLIERYINKDHKQTVDEITQRYAPSAENDHSAYLAYVANASGLQGNTKIDPTNTSQVATLMAAMLHIENRRNNYSPAQVQKIIVQNNSGGNAVVGANQVAAGQ